MLANGISGGRRAATGVVAALVLVLSGTPARGQVLGPDAVACGPGTTATAILVQIGDYRNRRGTLRVRLFGGDPATYFDRDRALVRIQVPVPAADSAAICVRVPGPGVYAVDVRHDVNGNDVTDRGDGGGISGNPRLTMWDLLFRRRPSPAVTQITVGNGVTTVSIRIRYL